MTADHYKLIRLICLLGFILVILGVRLAYLNYPTP